MERPERHSGFHRSSTELFVPMETQSDKPRGLRGRAPSVIIILSVDFRMANGQEEKIWQRMHI